MREQVKPWVALLEGSERPSRKTFTLNSYILESIHAIGVGGDKERIEQIVPILVSKSDSCVYRPTNKLDQ